MYQQIETVHYFLELLNTIESDWDNLHDEIKQSEYEQEDFLHEIELSPLNSYEGFVITKKLQEVRQRRRELKNLKEVLLPLKDFLDHNQKMKIDLFKVLTSMEKVEDNQSIRSYYPRVRTDIKLAKKRMELVEAN